MFSSSRRFLRSFGMVVLAAGLAQPAMVSADYPGGPLVAPGGPGSCCAPSCAPCCVPCCQPPDICTCTSFKPIVNTCYRPQPYMAYRDVCRTCYRQEPYCVTVPVQKVDCITCDEGCYKMVWCPRIVTKQIPRVEYHQQTCCRTVPYTVNQRIPYMATTMVPECHVRYCPETHTFMKPACPTCPCPPCGCGAPAVPGCCGPMSQATPNGAAPQGMAASPLPMQQQAVNPGEGAPLQAVPSSGNESPAFVASTNDAANNPYLRAQSNANVWQASQAMAR